MVLFKSKALLFALMIFTFSLSFVQAQESPRFQVTADTADVITPVGGQGVMSVGFYIESMYPTSQPFSSERNGNREDLRLQVPVGFGVEGSYGITRNIEVGLGLGMDFFKTQQFKGPGANPGQKIYHEVKYRLYPITGIVRYRWPMRVWNPEIELGLGTALGNIQVRETSNAEKFKQSGPFMRGHLAVGSGFSWGEWASIHFQIGYGLNKIGKKTYSDGSYTVDQEEMMSGVFSKAFMRFYF